MTLYYYKKAPIQRSTKQQASSTHRQYNNPTVETVINAIPDQMKQKIASIRPVTFILPIILIISGLSILLSQIKPYAVHFIQAKVAHSLDKEIIPLVPESYEEIRTAYISDPGAQYFSHLIETDEQILKRSQYQGKFFLTIEKIHIVDAPVIANVDSLNEQSYREALSTGLAHFKGTKLPGEYGNIFIYGHSAAGDYPQRNLHDVVTAFSRLFQLNIGDKITIKFEDTTYQYTVKKIKEITPDQTDILHTQVQQKTLTLMTCSPPGLNTGRLIVVATQQ